MVFKNLADTSLRNVYDFSYEQKAVVRLRVLYPLLFLIRPKPTLLSAQ